MKVGFIGLGRMGEAMSRRLLDGGHEVAVYNRTADKTKPLVDLGAKPAASIGEVGNSSRAVFTMLTDDAAVMDVVGKPDGPRETMPTGGIHICCSQTWDSNGIHRARADRAQRPGMVAKRRRKRTSRQWRVIWDHLGHGPKSG
jgi:3-hydroxyisobutyrate dehydrogenase-like beta-hydroxyacid dehydrogenase